MKSFNELWKVDEYPHSDDGMGAVTSHLTVINSAKMLDRLNLPIRVESVLSVVCLEGELTLTVDMMPFKLTKNSIMVLGPGRVISDYSESHFKGFSMMAKMTALACALPYLSRVVVCFMHYHSNPIIQISEEEALTQKAFHDLLQRKLVDLENNEYTQMVVKRLGEAILYETIGLFNSHIEQPYLSSYRRGDDLFYRFLTLVEKNYKRERSVSFYASKMCVTPKHLSAVIKESSGKTAGEWIDSFVMLEAKMLLSSSDKSIQQVSVELNFPNQSFFGKYFKHHAGKSPRQYRNENIQD